MTRSPPPPPSSPGSGSANGGQTVDVSVTGLTPGKLLLIVGGVIGSVIALAGAIVWVLVSLVYGGLQEKIQEVRDANTRSLTTISDRVQGLDNTFRTAVTSAISVQDLLQRSPELEKKINETRDAVIGHTAQLQALQQSASQHTQQLQGLQGTMQALQGSVNDTRERVIALQGTTREIQTSLDAVSRRLPVPR
jgi:hypothetical protein